MKRFSIILLSLLIISASLLAQGVQDTRHVRMGVVLPLKEKNARGAKMVEFYRGLLMAVDSMKHEGLSIDVYAMHSGASAADMDALVVSRQMKDCDIIFGPLDAAQLTGLADYCDLNDKILVVPFSSSTYQATGHQRFFTITAPQETIQQEALWFVQDQFANHNVIIVDCNEKNEEGKAFTEQLKKDMSERGVYVRPLNIDSDDDAFLQAFHQDRKNLIVLNSTSVKALNQLTPKLNDFKRQHPEYQFSLFGYPAWQTYTSQLLSEFYAFDTYIYTTFYRNPLSQRCEALDRQFMNWFHTPMSNTFPRYALMGFDIGYFFLRGLSIYGKERLPYNIAQVPSRPYQHPLYFEQMGDGNGYLNTFVQLVHYTPYQSIELITRNH